MKFIGLLLGSMMILGGCATGNPAQEYSRGMTNVNQSNALIAASYFETRTKTNDKIIEKMAESGNTTALVLYGIITAQQDAKVAETFKAMALEKMTTNADIGLAFVENTLPVAIKFASIAWLGSEIVNGFSSAGSVSTSFGDGATAITDSNVAGSYNLFDTNTLGEGASLPFNSSLPLSTDNSVSNIGE